MPFVDHCDAIVPAYRKLVGLAIRPGYHQRVKELLGGVRGCTHITELAGSLATAAFQTLAGQGLAGSREEAVPARSLPRARVLGRAVGATIRVVQGTEKSSRGGGHQHRGGASRDRA